MHDIEPHYHWRDRYKSEQDRRSPFYGREYDEFGFHNQVYNYLLHPQWDDFGSETLYLKILFVDYKAAYAILEMIGEWNDALHNDVMHLKREVLDTLIEAGVRYFILITEQVLNYHADDDSYYEEWFEDIEGGSEGWIVLLNALEHVCEEMKSIRLDNYLYLGGVFSALNWRPQKPERIFEAVEGLVQKDRKRLY